MSLPSSATVVSVWFTCDEAQNRGGGEVTPSTGQVRTAPRCERLRPGNAASVRPGPGSERRGTFKSSEIAWAALSSKKL